MDVPEPGGPPAVLVSDRQDLPVDVEGLVDLARATLAGEGLGAVELSVSFVDEAEMEDLHVRYLGEPGPTDVLSFPQDGDGLVGDVVICPAVAARNHADDPGAELRLLVVHGILHLLGHDHEEPGEKAVMWTKQERYSGIKGAVMWGWILALVLVAFGSVLAMAESSLTRLTRVRALALQSEGRRNATTLVRIESDPPRYLNSVYLAVMLCQNGSAVLVAVLAERAWGSGAVTIASFVFVLVYFVIVEAMSKTLGIQRSDRVALTLSPLVYLLGRILSLPTRGLIGLANILLPGRGLREGPFVSEGDIRSMAEVGHEEGSIHEDERELIHSIFEFGDTIVREVMVPRPDIIAVEDSDTLRDVQALVLEHGYSRLPVYHEDLDEVIGVVFAKDVLKAIHQGTVDVPLADVVRQARWVPESKRVADLLREMQKEKFHQALVTDEYGSVTGIVSLEDLLEELVGEISDEYDTEEEDVVQVGDGVFRISGKTSIDDLNETLGAELPDEDWDTVAGLVLDLFGKIPDAGETTALDGWEFEAEVVVGRRIATVVVRQLASDEPDAEDVTDDG